MCPDWYHSFRVFALDMGPRPSGKHSVERRDAVDVDRLQSAGRDVKSLLVGESNPYGADPEFALYPSPRGCSGDRLCRLVLRMDPDDYIEKFDRVNLCAGPWSTPKARVKAREIFERRNASSEDGPVVMLGAKVTNAFLIPFRPFTVTGRYVCLPHPSGLSRAWNDPCSYALARSTMERAGVVAHLDSRVAAS